MNNPIKLPKRIVNGILIIDKPKGLSSNIALQKVKRIFNAKKAGHTGSLDPLATGVLPICFGTSTKLSQSLLDSDKKYVVTCKLGMMTTTGDAEGEIINPVDLKEFTNISDNILRDIINSFLGEQEQVPSMYSAIKHNGTPLYKLARQGIEVPRKSRIIKIYSIENINIKRIDNVLDTIDLTISCSKGTYIRTLIEDMGKKIGCGAYVSDLRRIAAGPYAFDNTNIMTIPDLERLAQNNSLDYSQFDQLLY